MDFRQAMTASGLIPRDIVADGRWYRCATTDKPKRKNGCYMLRVSGDRGFWKNYALDDEWSEWRDDKPVSVAERRRSDAELADMRKREVKRRLEAMRQMRERWESLPPLRGGHPYLEGKGLSMMGCVNLRADGDLMVIPMHRAGSIMSFQTIGPTGEKKYRYGCPIKGSSLALRRPGAVVTCLAEGFATGLAIYQTLPQASVIVCFDAGNMVEVAKDLKVKGMTVVCADNDWQTLRKRGTNPGIERGRSAAEALGCGVAYPEGIWGSDWADALQEWREEGPGRLRVEIMRHARPIF